MESLEKNGKLILSVAELNEYIKTVFESSEVLNGVYVKGEISNFTNHYKTGHFYFTIKDNSSVIRAVMFKGNAQKLKFLPENGMKIIALGRVSVFPRDGQYQIYCEQLEPDGIGSLYAAFEGLKKKLGAEGLFDTARKKPIKRIPMTIGIITSPTGAAIRDMINVITRRFPITKIILFPALVQGANAPKQLISGIRFFNSRKKVDTIIIGRGGGSLEELWAFNDEELARAVFASETPVISAVGHETDFTICDFTADLRAPTPSAAAELAVPDMAEYKAALLGLVKKMELRLENRIRLNREKINRFAGARYFKNPAVLTDEKRMTLLRAEKDLISAVVKITEKKRADFILNSSKLEVLSPIASLSRGYSIAYDGEGGIISGVGSLAPGDSFTLRLKDGTVGSEVKAVERLK